MADQEVTITVRGKNLSGPELEAAKRNVEELKRAADRAHAEFLTGQRRLKDWGQALGQAGTATTGLGGSLKGLMSQASGMASMFGVTLGAGALLRFGQSVVQRAGEIQDLADRMGVSAEAAQRFKFAAEQTGSSLDAVQRGIVKMNDNLANGSKSTVGALAAAGLKFEDIRRQKPESAFLSIVSAVGRIEDPMRRTQVMLELFGRTGAELLPGVAANFADLARSATVSSNESIAALDAFGDRLSRLASDSKAHASNIAGAMVMSVDTWEKFGRLMAAMAGGGSAVPFVLQQNLAEGLGQAAAAAGAKPPPPAPRPDSEALRRAKESLDLATKWSRLEVETEIAKWLAAAQEFERRGLEPTNEAIRAVTLQVDKWIAAGYQVPEMLRRVRDENLQLVYSLVSVEDQTAKLIRQASALSAEFRIDDASSAAQRVAAASAGLVKPTDLSLLFRGATLPASGPRPEFGRQLIEGLKPHMQALAMDFPSQLASALRHGQGLKEAFRSLAVESGAMVGQEWGKTIASGLKTGENGAVSFLAKMLPGGIGLALSGVGALVGKLFGKREGARVNDTRDEFMTLQGGFSAVQQTIAKFNNDPALAAAFNRLYFTGKEGDFKSGMEAYQKRLKELFGEQTDAQDLLNGAIQKYGFTVDELGPKWRATRLKEEASQLLQEYTALTASGIENATVQQHMGRTLFDYLQTVKKSNGEIDASMRPMLEQAIRLGTLVGENGEKIESLDGFTFSETFSKGVDRMIKKLDELIRKLTGDLGGALDDTVDRLGVVTGSGVSDYGKPIGRRPDYQMATGGLVTGPATFAIERGRREIVGDEYFMERALTRALERTGRQSTGTGPVFNLNLNVTAHGSDGKVMSRQIAEEVVGAISEVLRSSGASRTRMRSAMGLPVGVGL